MWWVYRVITFHSRHHINARQGTNRGLPLCILVVVSDSHHHTERPFLIPSHNGPSQTGLSARRSKVFARLNPSSYSSQPYVTTHIIQVNIFFRGAGGKKRKYTPTPSLLHFLSPLAVLSCLCTRSLILCPVSSLSSFKCYVLPSDHHLFHAHFPVVLTPLFNFNYFSHFLENTTSFHL